MLIVYIHNDGTGTNNSANYTYQVCVNDVVIETGEVKGHDRDKGWRKLVEEVSKQDTKPLGEGS
jgi:hypothetical protein